MQSSLKQALGATALVCALIVLAFPAAASAFGPLSSFGSWGTGAGQIESPEDIAVGPDGSTYIADFQNYRVDVFGPEGAFKFAFGQQVNPQDGGDLCTAASGCVRGEGSADGGSLDGPSGVAVGADGTVYVAEYETNRISAFSPQGRFLFAFGRDVAISGGDLCTVASDCQASPHASGAGEMYNPVGIGVAPNGDVYVADRQNDRVDVFSGQGAFRFAFGKAVAAGPSEASVCDATTGCEKGLQSSASGGIGPSDVAIAPDGRVLVSDSFRRVSVFSPAGAFLYAFGGKVDAVSGADRCTANCTEGLETAVAGAIPNPQGIGISSSPLSGSEVFVADGVDLRVVEYTLDGQFVRAFGEGVATGASAFETCTYATGCRRGLEGTVPGSTSWPIGLAVDCRGAVQVGEYVEGAPDPMIRVERFGELGTPAPSSCPISPSPPEAQPAPRPTPPSNRFTLGKLKLNKRLGTATLSVFVPGAGRLTLGGKGVKPTSATARAAATVKLIVKPGAKAKRQLLALGKAKVRVSVTFTPSGGSAATQSMRLTLRKNQ